MNSNEKIRHITPERAQEILLANGVKISLDKAALVLDLMYKMANFEIEQNQLRK